MDTLQRTRKTLSIDAVTASVEETVERLTRDLCSILGAVLYPARPLPGMGYSHAAEIVHPDTLGRRCLVLYGEAHTKPLVFAEGTHEYDAPALYDALCTHYAGRWSPSRLDTALDFHDAPEAFDILAAKLTKYALYKGITLDHKGDWTRGKGRTLYLYSRTSRFFVRLYEYRQHHGHGPDCRLELETKLKGQPARLALANRAPMEMLSMCPATFQVVYALDLMDAPIVVTPGPRPPSTVERDRAFLASTAYPALLRMISHHAGAIEAAILDVLAYREETERTRALLHEQPSVTIPGNGNPE